MTVGRRNIDDAASALTQHHPQLMFHAEERAEYIGIERRGIAVGGLFGHPAGLALSGGAVDGGIQTSETRDGLIGCPRLWGSCAANCPNIEIVISSETSPELAHALSRRKIDVAFLRPVRGMPDLVFEPLIKEPLIAVLRTDHRLAALNTFSAENLVGETFISVANTAPQCAAIDDYLRCSGFDITPDHEATSTYMAISLVVSTRGIALLPLHTENFLPPSVTSRPIEGEAPTIELVLGYHKANKSPLLKVFLSKVSDLIAGMSTKARRG